MRLAPAVAALLCLAAPAIAADAPKALHLSINAIYPPMEFKDPATDKLTGLDIDLGEAIAKRLGTTVTWSENAFEQLIPSLQTGRSDFILSGLSDLPARRETMDFIDYLKSGAQFYTVTASPVTTQEGLCGLHVATSRSTSFPAQIQAWSAAHCEAAGKAAIVVVPAESTVDARTQLKQGRVDAAVQGSETVPYFMSLDPGTYRPIGTAFTTVYQGMAFPKGSIALRESITAAFASMIKDSTYTAILDKWHLTGNAVAAPLLNGQPMP